MNHDEFLEHHGIKGMKWGIRRYQDEQGNWTEEGLKHRRMAEKNLKKATVSKLDKWGMDSSHNVLYLTGASGSGKSVTALGMSKKNDSIIHIDTLLDEESYKYNGNKDFEKFCESKGIDTSIARSESASIKDRIKALDDISKQIEPYGKKKYNEGSKVIVEGVQLAEETIFPDKSYFEDKPLVVLNTGKMTSAIRAAKRDNSSIKDILKDAFDEDRSKWYDKVSNDMDQIKHDELMHHGIKGMKWGVRHYQDSNGNWTEEGLERRRKGSKHFEELPNYDGPAYFISEKKLEHPVMLPRVPKNYFTENGFEDDTTNRVSFAPTVDDCLAGLSKNVEGKTLYIYEPVDISKCEMAKPDTTAVPDSSITNELWCLNAVEVHHVGTIEVTGNRGEAGKKFTYGDNEAELYNDWEYVFK